MKDIAAVVRMIVANHLAAEESHVTGDASFIEDLGADEMDMEELAMAFEEEFGIKIPPEVANSIDTVDNAVNIISSFGRS